MRTGATWLDALIDVETAIDEDRRVLDAAARSLTEVQGRLATHYADRADLIQQVIERLWLTVEPLPDGLVEELNRLAEREPDSDVGLAIQRATAEWVA